MKRKHAATLDLIFAQPVSGSVKWQDIEALFVALGAEVSEREGSRIGVFLFGEVRVFTGRIQVRTPTKARYRAFANGLRVTEYGHEEHHRY